METELELFAQYMGKPKIRNNKNKEKTDEQNASMLETEAIQPESSERDVMQLEETEENIASEEEEELKLNIEEDEEKMHQFDVDCEYGPAENMTREERYNRAVKVGLNPPPYIREILKRGTCDEYSRIERRFNELNDSEKTFWEKYE